jgi:hypothetical protein
MPSCRGKVFMAPAAATLDEKDAAQNFVGPDRCRPHHSAWMDVLQFLGAYGFLIFGFNHDIF